MAYEQFKRTQGRPTSGAFMTISALGRFTLTTDCYQTYFKDYDAVLLFYDKTRNFIGIKPIKGPNDEAYDLKITRAKSPTYSFSGTAFLSHIDVKYEKSKRFKPTYNETDGMVEIDLNNPLN